MFAKKKEHPKEKEKLHPRNKHRARYDFKQLIADCPPLKQFVSVNPFGDESIDFFSAEAVKMLNKALLKHFYQVDNWDIPAGYLCPPIPGRADYIHYAADLLAGCNNGKIPSGNKIKCLDIGVGANCIYPLIGNREYGWRFVGSDVDPVSAASANKIIELNPILAQAIEIRLQPNSKGIFKGIIQKGERFDLTVCNPPFHASLADARTGTIRKLKNLHQKKITKPVLNFGGQGNELWCEGGETKFVQRMINESKLHASSCFWFTTLISKQSNLKNVYANLEEVKAFEVKTILMAQGNKTGRIVSWTFLNRQQQQKWIAERWD